jgi:heme exporter protein D
VAGRGRGRSLKIMHWSSWSQFFSMGGYALYIWGSYGVTFVLLAGEVLLLTKRKRSLNKGRRSSEFAARGSKLRNRFVVL